MGKQGARDPLARRDCGVGENLQQIRPVMFAHNFIQFAPSSALQFFPVTFELGVDDQRFAFTFEHQVR